MLKQLIIILANRAATPKKISMEKKLRQLNEQGLPILQYEVSDLLWKEPDEYKEEIQTHSLGETLWITDTSAVAAKICEMGGYCIAYLHSENQNQDFSMIGYAFEDFKQLDKDYFIKIYQRFRGEAWHILSTRRCEIRESRVADVDAFYEIYAEPSITYYMENLYEDKEEEKEYIQTYIDKVYTFLGFGMWTVVDRKSAKIIGRAGFSLREGYDEPELGFVIDKRYQRQGYAYEVCNALINYAKKELEFRQIRAIVHQDNEISQRLCSKLGFKVAGETFLDGATHKVFIKKLKNS